MAPQASSLALSLRLFFACFLSYFPFAFFWPLFMFDDFIDFNIFFNINQHIVLHCKILILNAKIPKSCTSHHAFCEPLFANALQYWSWLQQNQEHRHFSSYRFREDNLLRASSLLCWKNRVDSRGQGIRLCWSHHGLYGAGKIKRYNNSVSCDSSHLEGLPHQSHRYSRSRWFHNRGRESFKGSGWSHFDFVWCWRCPTANSHS